MLRVLGVLCGLDPAKESTPEALRRLQHHGVTVKILTGDNAVVARKICRDVGLDVNHVATGAEIEPLDDQTLGDLVERSTILAKLSPLQKARVVRVLEDRGHTVGFLGDGINDATALREADVGISVDTAVDVALPFSPLAPSLHLVPLPAPYFLYLPVVLLAYCLLTQVVKTLYRKRYQTWL